MHELYCPSCNTPSHFDFSDYLLMCPVCSVTFTVNLESGVKEIYGDHYIVPNTIDPAAVKELSVEWLMRLHHRPGMAPKEYFIVDIQGFSVPLWITSLEGHTAWKGLIKKQKNYGGPQPAGGEYLIETGQFRRGYRWAISARKNICETWGLSRLHIPAEDIKVDWDGFPLDSTVSRGRLVADEKAKSAYDIRKYFEFKFANGLPILGVQTSEEEALRRTQSHIQTYHRKLASLNVEYLIDHQTELEVAGIQLMHVPFWKVSYVYRPKTVLRHFVTPKEHRLIIDGYGKGILNAELAIQYHEKVLLNGIVCGISALIFLTLGLIWHPAFMFVALFAAILSGISFFLGVTRKAKKAAQELAKKHDSHKKTTTEEILVADPATDNYVAGGGGISGA